MDLSALMDLREKRTRSKNYTVEEQKMLFKIIEPHLPVLRSRTMNTTIAQKQAAWSEIARVFNAYNGMPRSIESLQGCYKNMKTKMKQDRELSGASTVSDDTMNKEAFLHAEWSIDETLSEEERMLPTHPVITIEDGFQNCKNTSKPEKIDPLEYGETKRRKRSIDDVNVSDVSKNKREHLNLGNKIEIPKKNLVPNIYNGETRRRKIDDDNIMRDVSERKRELLNLQQSIATEQLKETMMNVTLKELEIEHKRNIYKLELEELNMKRQLSEQKLKMELMLMELQMKQLENN